MAYTILSIGNVTLLVNHDSQSMRNAIGYYTAKGITGFYAWLLKGDSLNGYEFLCIQCNKQEMYNCYSIELCLSLSVCVMYTSHNWLGKLVGLCGNVDQFNYGYVARFLRWYIDYLPQCN